ncbi:conserved hypothetical protein [Desulfamplus magnetovallimortis]|uniref:Uncharacterized protein n=1 Tax=Desulfamplus magnetovallimortis TaxID=1246637 RepID=A0A1W1HGM9_9BACT|nr:hypothetical protein [Desulfamplus magnetovallimortis]SLM31620.1 conserved hypothetical protein [Desulfamplus magnetovallimortis]
MTENKLALKPYIQAIETHCSKLSREELMTTILNFAKDVPVNGRQTFLDKLYSISPVEIEISPDEAEAIKEDIFGEIEGLHEKIQERIESIEDGSYWDDIDYEESHNSYGYYRDEYDDEEEPDYVTEEDCKEVIYYFEQAEDLFLDGELVLARDIYARLFNLLEDISELEYNMSQMTSSFDIRESRARYCRCVYDTAKKEERINEFMEAIELYAPISEETLNIEKEKFPMLQDIMDAGTEELKEKDDFLKQWLTALEKHTSRRAATLSLEVSAFLNGTKGVAALAKKWGAAQPIGFLYWTQLLVKEEQWQAASQAALESLSVLPNTSLREQAADYLILCGEKLENSSLILTGKREKLISVVSETNFLNFVDEINKQKIREKELANLKDVIKKADNPNFRSDNNIYAKFLLVSGDITTAYDSVKKDRQVGWSSGNAGLVFGAVLYIICGRSDKATRINTLLKHYADGSGTYLRHRNKKNNGISMSDEILKGLKQCQINEADKADMWEWATTIGQDRIDHIVSNKHRNAYERAASVLGALSECFILLDQKPKAQALAKEYYSTKYSRFSAFRSEVKAVFQDSNLLRSLEL